MTEHQFSILNGIKIGQWKIAVRELDGQLVGVCGECGNELKGEREHYWKHYAESEWYFCSESCATSYIHRNKPEGGY